MLLFALLMNRPEQDDQRNRERVIRAKNFARSIGGYALGLVGVGVAAGGMAGSAPVLGMAAGAGMIYASREVMRPLYKEAGDQTTEQPHKESRVRRFGRGLIFTAGMAVNYLGASLMGNALFGGHGLNAGERVASGLFGAAALIPGDAMIRASYKPELYGPVERLDQQTVTEPVAA
jgi:hypothetical protein